MYDQTQGSGVVFFLLLSITLMWWNFPFQTNEILFLKNLVNFLNENLQIKQHSLLCLSRSTFCEKLPERKRKHCSGGMCNDRKSETSKIVIMLRHMDHYLLVLLQYLQYYPPPRAPVNELLQKSNKRLMARTITGETKREGQRKAKICTAYRNQKKRERVSSSRDRKLSHPWPRPHAHHEI